MCPAYCVHRQHPMSEDAALGERDQAEIDGLLEHWKQTLELRNDQATTFDKSILWASGGALALTLANVDKITGGDGITAELIWCWAAFSLSVAVNIVSYWTSTLDTEKELDKIRVCIEGGTEPYVHGNIFRTVTYALNAGALLLFLGGMGLLMLHCYNNLVRH